MRTLLFLFVLMVASSAAAVPKPSAVCKADLTAWSQSTLEASSAAQLLARMNELISCADLAHRHRHSDVLVLRFIVEFYRANAQFYITLNQEPPVRIAIGAGQI
jgi:hypothetical protein